jgi:hypothetical protein
MRTLLLSALVLLATTVFAQTDETFSTKGFSMGIHLNATSWHLDEPDLDLEGSDNGGGGGLNFGYGVSDLVTLFLNLDGASIDPGGGQTYTLGHGDLGARFIFGTPVKKFRPLAQVALTGAAAEIGISPNTIELSGGGLTLGGGFLYFLSQAWALDVGLDLTFGSLTEVKLNNVSVDTDITARTSRLNAGVRWYPGR